MSHDTTHEPESDTTTADADEIDSSRRNALKAIAYTGMCATAVPAASEVAQEATDDDEDSEPPEDFVPASVNPSRRVNCIEQSICLAVNEHRVAQDQDPLAFNENVAAVARYHSEYMAEQGELSEASEYYDTHAARLEAADVECEDPAWILDDTDEADPDMASAVADAFLSAWIDDEELHDLLHTDSTNHGVGVAITDDGTIYVSYIACGSIESEMDMEQVEEQEQEQEQEQDDEQDEEDAQEEQDEEQEQDDTDEQEQAVPEDTPTGVFADNVHGELTVTVEDESGSTVEGYPVMMNGELYQTDENGEVVYQIGDGHDDTTTVEVTVDGETQTAEIDHGDNSDVELSFTVSTDDEGEPEMNMADPEEAAEMEDDDEQEQEQEQDDEEDVGMPLSMDVDDDEAAIEDHIDSDTHIPGYRADEGVGEIEHRDDLAAVARWQSEYVAANDPNELQHEDDMFGTVADRLDAAGIDCSASGEVLAMVPFDGDTTDAAHTIAEGWLDSAGHREIILGDFDAYGVGVHISDDGIAYATGVFCGE